MTLAPDTHPIGAPAPVVLAGALAVSVGGLVLVGDSFTGKTTAAYHLLELAARDEWWPGLAITSDQLNRIPELVLGGSFGELREKLRDRENLLVLDDFDKVRFSPRTAAEVWSLIEFRLRGDACPSPLVITMNVRSRAGFLKLFASRESDDKKTGLSIYNRLVAHCEFIDFDATERSSER